MWKNVTADLKCSGLPWMNNKITMALGIIENWGRWSEMVAVKLPDIMSGSITFENILSVRVLEWLVIIVVKLKE